VRAGPERANPVQDEADQYRHVSLFVCWTYDKISPYVCLPCPRMRAGTAS